jgi:hypothetical protein
MDQVLKKALILDHPDDLFRNAAVETQAKDDAPTYGEKVEDVPAPEILPQ